MATSPRYKVTHALYCTPYTHGVAATQRHACRFEQAVSTAMQISDIRYPPAAVRHKKTGDASPWSILHFANTRHGGYAILDKRTALHAHVQDLQ